MKTDTKSDEIDLLEVIKILSKKKKKIFFIVLIAVILNISYSFIVYEKPLEQYEVKLTARPISTYSEIDYLSFNNFLKFQEKFAEKDKVIYLNENNVTSEDLVINEYIYKNYKVNSSLFDGIEFKQINKFYLFELFYDILNNNNVIDEIIKNSEVLKNKKNYINDENLENMVKKLSNNVKIEIARSPNDNQDELKIVITNIVEDLEMWKQIIIEIEKEVNERVRQYLTENFNANLEDIAKFKKFYLEEIDRRIVLNNKNKNNDQHLNTLDLLRSNIANSKNFDRLNLAFKNTPINDEKNFTAANIDIEKISIRDLTIFKNHQVIKSTILVFILSLFLSISYIMLVHILKKSSNNPVE